MKKISMSYKHVNVKKEIVYGDPSGEIKPVVSYRATKNLSRNIIANHVDTTRCNLKFVTGIMQLFRLATILAIAGVLRHNLHLKHHL